MIDGMSPGSIDGREQEWKSGRIGRWSHYGKACVINISRLRLRSALYHIFSLEEVLREVIAPIVAVFDIDKKKRQEANSKKQKEPTVFMQPCFHVSQNRK